MKKLSCPETNLVVADFDVEIFSQNFTRHVFPLAKQVRSRTVRSLASLDEATRKGLTFPRAVHLFFDKPLHGT